MSTGGLPLSSLEILIIATVSYNLTTALTHDSNTIHLSGIKPVWYTHIQDTNSIFFCVTDNRKILKIATSRDGLLQLSDWLICILVNSISDLISLILI